MAGSIGREDDIVVDFGIALSLATVSLSDVQSLSMFLRPVDVRERTIESVT